jgi:hypothetical protein
MPQSVFTTNDELCQRLTAALPHVHADRIRFSESIARFAVVTRPGNPSHHGQTVDVVVMPNEINNNHGTGPLVKRILAGRTNAF